MKSAQLYIMILLLFFGMNTYSQEDAPLEENVITTLPKFVLEANFMGLIPQGQIAEFLDGFEWGFEGQFLYRIQHNKPFFIGLGFRTNTFERDAISYEAVYDDGTIFTQREITKTHLVNGSVVTRFQPEWNWLVQPYMQGSFGVNHYFANTNFRDADAGEDIETINEQKSFKFAYGMRAGILIIPNVWYIRGNMSIGYTRNATTDLLSFDEDSNAVLPIDNFFSVTTPADYLMIYLGVTYIFD